MFTTLTTKLTTTASYLIYRDQIGETKKLKKKENLQSFLAKIKHLI